MNYIHPLIYRGYKSTFRDNIRLHAFVEANCLKCTNFCGQEHDFSECNRNFSDINCTCPTDCRRNISLIDPVSEIKLCIVNEENSEAIKQFMRYYYSKYD